VSIRQSGIELNSPEGKRSHSFEGGGIAKIFIILEPVHVAGGIARSQRRVRPCMTRVDGDRLLEPTPGVTQVMDISIGRVKRGRVESVH
jgi:hypothetical protein